MMTTGAGLHYLDYLEARQGVGDDAELEPEPVGDRAHERPPGRRRARRWWGVLGFRRAPATRQEAESAYRRLVRERHPDRGGSEAEFRELRTAIEEARAYFGA